MTIHPIRHTDYSRLPRVDHLFVVDVGNPNVVPSAALLVSVTDTGLDCVLDDNGTSGRPSKGWSLTWAEVLSAVQESDHNGVVTLTTVRSTADDADESIEDPGCATAARATGVPCGTHGTAPARPRGTRGPTPRS